MSQSVRRHELEELQRRLDQSRMILDKTGVTPVAVSINGKPLIYGEFYAEGRDPTVTSFGDTVRDIEWPIRHDDQSRDPRRRGARAHPNGRHPNPAIRRHGADVQTQPRLAVRLGIDPARVRNAGMS